MLIGVLIALAFGNGAIGNRGEVTVRSGTDEFTSLPVACTGPCDFGSALRGAR